MQVGISGSQNAAKNATPKRIVLRFNVLFEREEPAILEAFVALYGLEDFQDYYVHLCAPNESSKMHIVLDLQGSPNG